MSDSLAPSVPGTSESATILFFQFFRLLWPLKKPLLDNFSSFLCTKLTTSTRKAQRDGEIAKTLRTCFSRGFQPFLSTCCIVLYPCVCVRASKLSHFCSPLVKLRNSSETRRGARSLVRPVSAVCHLVDKSSFWNMGLFVPQLCSARNFYLRETPLSLPFLSSLPPFPQALKIPSTSPLMTVRSHPTSTSTSAFSNVTAASA